MVIIIIRADRKRELLKFKEQCLSLLENVDKNGKLVSIEVQSSELIEKLKGEIKIKGDIMSTGSKWHAQS